jgi:N-acetylmuramoyl-L-alanine amidase
MAVRGALARLGYDVPAGGPFDEDLAVVVTAFQRHWLQSRCDGVADGDTRARLMAILRLASAGG